MVNEVAAVVVTYNRLHLLKKCIELLSKQSYKCDILIVDNASEDGTSLWVESLNAKFNNAVIKYHNIGENIGGAGGFNYGIRWAYESGYKYLWLMDDDCMPEPNALEELCKADRILNGDYGWLSSIVLWRDRTACTMNRPKLSKNFYEDIENISEGMVRADQATFVSLFIKASVVYDVGLPIKEFFIWGDDVEYTRRISIRHKKKCFVVGRSKVIHAMKNNDGSNIALDYTDRLDRYRLAYRNENYLYRKEHIKGALYYLAKCMYHILRIVKYKKEKMFLRIWIIISSMCTGVLFNPKIEMLGDRYDDVECP